MLINCIFNCLLEFILFIRIYISDFLVGGLLWVEIIWGAKSLYQRIVIKSNGRIAMGGNEIIWGATSLYQRIVIKSNISKQNVGGTSYYQRISTYKVLTIPFYLIWKCSDFFVAHLSLSADL
jgi:hypothetical protein